MQGKVGGKVAEWSLAVAGGIFQTVKDSKRSTVEGAQKQEFTGTAFLEPFKWTAVVKSYFSTQDGVDYIYMRGQSNPICARWGPQSKSMGGLFSGKSIHCLHGLAFLGLDQDTAFLLKTRGNMTLERGLDILAGRSFYPIIQKLQDNCIKILVVKKYNIQDSEASQKLSKEKLRQQKGKRLAELLPKYSTAIMDEFNGKVPKGTASKLQKEMNKLKQQLEDLD